MLLLQHSHSVNEPKRGLLFVRGQRPLVAEIGHQHKQETTPILHIFNTIRHFILVLIKQQSIYTLVLFGGKKNVKVHI